MTFSTLTFLQEKFDQLFSVLHPSAIPHAASARERCCWEHRPPPEERPDNCLPSSSLDAALAVNGFFYSHNFSWARVFHSRLWSSFGTSPTRPLQIWGRTVFLFSLSPGPWVPISSGIPLNLSLPP